MSITFRITFICYFHLVILSSILTASTNPTAVDIRPISPDSIVVALDSGWVFYRKHNYESMAQYLEEHLSRTQEIDNIDSLTLELHYALILAYGHLDRHDKMFESIVRGLQLAQAMDNRWMLLSLFRELGSFHDDPLDDQETGLIYMKKAIPYLDAVKANSKCGLMMDIGLSSVNAGQLDSAKYYYDRAFDYMTEDSVMLPDLYSFYAPYLLKTNQLDQAEYYLDHTYKIWREMGFDQGYTESCIDLAQLHFRKENYSKALSYALEAAAKSKEIKNIFLLADAVEWQAKSQEALNLLEQGLDSYRLLNQLKDSISIIKKKQQLDQKRLEFVALSYKDELEHISAFNQRLSTQMSFSKKALLGATFSFFIVGLVFYNSLRSKRQKISELSETITFSQEEKSKLQEEYVQAIEELEKNRRELTSSALFLEKKDEALKSVRKMLSKIEIGENSEAFAAIKSARKLADSSINIDNNWESFRYFFEQVFPSFYSEIKKDFSSLNQNELRYLSYIKMGLTDKEAARLLGINTASFQKSKYRLKKKLGLPKELSINDMLAKY